MKKSRIIAAALACVMVVASVAGCGSSSSSSSSGSSDSSSTTAAAAEAAVEETEVEMTEGAMESNTVAENWDSYIVDGKTTIRVGIDQDPGTLDPFTTGSSNGKNATIKSPVYQTMGMIQGVGGELAPELAKSWTTDDNVHYEIELFDYIHDSDGNPITADDVVWSVERGKETGAVQNMNYVESIEKTGDYTVELTLTKPAVTLFERIMQSAYIVSRDAYEATGDNMAMDLVATGPYKVVDWVTGSSLVLEKVDDYWQTPELAAQDINQAANVDRIEFYVIKEASQLAIGLETGIVDLVYNLDAIEAQRFMEGGESSEGFNVFTSLNNLTQTMFLNASEYSILGSSPELRQAICYAVDAEAVMEGASDGYGIVCKTFGSDTLSDFNPAWYDEEYYEYDPDKAMELIAESGYNGETLRIVGNNSDLRTKIAQIVQAYLLAVGINSEIMTYDDTLFNTYKNDATEWDILLDNCGTSDQLMGMWRGKMANDCCVYGTANMAMDDELQALLELAENPATNSVETVNDLHQYIKDNAYVYGLYNQLSFTVGTDAVLDIAMNSTPWLMPSGCIYVWD